MVVVGEGGWGGDVVESHSNHIIVQWMSVEWSHA